MWLLDQMEPENCTYNVPLAFRLSGPLDVGALQRSISEIVRRHEALRTNFSIEDGQLMQIIAERRAVPFSVIDISILARAEREMESQRLLAEEFKRSFDLRSEPLIRLLLIKLQDDEHALLIMMHHIITDGWSVGIFFKELSLSYDAYCKGLQPCLRDLSVQYADVTVWQREPLRSEMLRRQFDYWRKKLAGAPALMTLPTDRVRPALQSSSGASESITLSEELSRALRGLSRQWHTTPFMTLLAAFKVLLYRYSGQRDLVVGCPIANRPTPVTEELIGFFVNTVLLRTDIDGRANFAHFLEQVRTVTLEAYDHQDLPFDQLIEELHPERSTARTPIANVFFSFEQTAELVNLYGLEVTRLALDGTTAKFDLLLCVSERTGGLHCAFEYSTDLYDRATIVRMLGHLRTLLRGIVDKPEQPISELPLLTAAERQQLVVGWNDTRRTYPANECVHQLFEAQVKRTPHSVAVVFGDEQITYRELNERANQLAFYLRGLGVTREKLVGISVEPSFEMVVGILAILKAGGAYMLLDPQYPQTRLAYMLENAQAPLLLSVKKLVDELPQHGARVLCLDSDWTEISACAKSNPPPQNEAGDLAYVIYTSASTGNPKGVLIPHRAVNRLVLNTNYISIKPSDVVAQVSNTSFDAATFEIWGALLNGARLVIMPKCALLTAAEIAAAIARHDISVMFLTTALFNHIVRQSPTVFAKLRYLLFGGEVANADCVKLVRHAGPPEHLLNVYGPTETATFASFYYITSTPTGETVPIGRPISNTEAFVLDAWLNPVPIGVSGELHIGGAGLARGYLNDAVLSAQKFIEHPFSKEPGACLYKTGDLVRWNSDGYIEFLGRIDRQVKVRGYRIELPEIENALKRTPLVSDAVVLVERGSCDERLVAYITASMNQTIDVRELKRSLRQTLPDYMVPAQIICVERLPLTPNGKLDAHALPKAAPSPAESNEVSAAFNWLHRRLLALWEEILGVKGINVKDNFFELGGHSLLAAQMMSGLEEGFGKRLPLSTLFMNPTIEHLADVLVHGSNTSDDVRVIAIQPKGCKPPLFFLHGDLTGGGFYCRGLSGHLGLDQPFYAMPPHGTNGIPILGSIEEMATDCIDAMRQVQAHGPYFLGGFCNGAVVAFEMARQLRTQGEKAQRLILVEPSTIGRRPAGLLTLSSRVAYEIVARAKRGLTTLSRSDLRLRTKLSSIARRLLRVIRRQKPPSGVLPATSTKDDIESQWSYLLEMYVPCHYEGRMALLAADEWHAVSRATLEWTDMAPKVKRYSLRGDHLACIFEFTEQTAAQLRDCLS